jgi:hypothetical protein
MNDLNPWNVTTSLLSRLFLSNLNVQYGTKLSARPLQFGTGRREAVLSSAGSSQPAFSQRWGRGGRSCGASAPRPRFRVQGLGFRGLGVNHEPYTLQPEARSPEPRAWSPESEARSPEPGARSLEPGAQNPSFCIRHPENPTCRLPSFHTFRHTDAHVCVAYTTDSGMATSRALCSPPPNPMV